MILTTYFNDFLKDIRLTDNQKDDLITGHTTLSKRLKADEELKEIIVSMFLQGSYKRSTAVRPKGDNRSDVDLVVVTNIDKGKVTSEEALNMFKSFMEKHYKDKYRIQRRSIGISLSYVDLDVVVTSAPSTVLEELIEKEIIQSTDELTEDEDTTDWKSEPLFIPDTEDDEWDETDPLAQIKFTIEKNKSCNGHYVNVVKALKWWKKNKDEENKAPKSYPLEHLIGQNCLDDIKSVAEGVVLTLESILDNHADKPNMPDHGVPEHDVFERVTDEEYDEFYQLVKDAAVIAREAYDSQEKAESVKKWRELFGSKFPNIKTENNSTALGFTSRTSKSEIQPERYA